MVLIVLACHIIGGRDEKNKKIHMLKNKLFSAIVTALTASFMSMSVVSAETYTAKSGDSWYGIADKYNVTANSLASANEKTIEDVLLEGQELQIPSYESGTGNSTSGNEYTVKANDSWYKIAEQFGVSAKELAKFNGKTLESVIIVGEKLQIPSYESGTDHSTNGNEYTVKANDSWYKIAEQFGVSAKELAKFNGKTLESVIIVGEKLQIPSSRTTTEDSNEANSNTKTTAKTSYTVQAGDSWYSIAKKFGITSTSIANINGRTINDTIYEGETIAIPTKSGETHNMSSSVLSSITLYNTPYGNSWYNIQLAASKLNGLQVKSGESFSWASYMGACGKEQGYLEAGVYQNGKPAKDYGGGVCFVSTCLMQSARAAGLEINEKHDHSNPVSYAARGDEASVSYGAWDMRFTNTTNSTVVFSVSTSSNGACTITCSIA